MNKAKYTSNQPVAALKKGATTAAESTTKPMSSGANKTTSAPPAPEPAPNNYSQHKSHANRPSTSNPHKPASEHHHQPTATSPSSSTGATTAARHEPVKVAHEPSVHAHDNRNMTYANALNATPADVIPAPKIAHTFEWKQGGGIVKVTGTWDNWTGPTVLKRVPGNQGRFEAIVDLDRTQKVLFKFIVDGLWKCTDEFETEYDQSGNQNNVLRPIKA
ncbi:hypothetical protein BGZ83_005897 [Gryganskiella cystojenkinii]|nr:hypothetical protein BGZ83_005897 [Gryganskiella cystojenkinii]